MYCYKCGKKVSSEDNFCLYCGTKIENNQSIETYEVKNEESISVKKNSKKTVLLLGLILSIIMIISVRIIDFKFVNNPKNINKLESTESVSQNSIDDNVSKKLEKITGLNKESHREKQVFATLLKSPKWLNENTDYTKSHNNVKFKILDINQDGVYEMLLSHGESGGLAGLTLSIVSYDVDEDKINAQKIGADHGGYRGYLNNQKTIVVGGATQGVGYMHGYKLEGDRYLKTFSTLDDMAGSAEESNIFYKLNDNDVSKEKYIEFLNSINTNLNYTEMYSINDENIRNILEIDPDTIKEDSSLERYSTLKFSTSEQAKEWLLKQDSNFIDKNNILSINEIDNNKSINVFAQHYYLEKDDYYLFVAMENGYVSEEESMKYLVGKHTGNVYLLNAQSKCYAYLIKDNQVIEKLKYDNEESTDWREILNNLL